MRNILLSIFITVVTSTLLNASKIDDLQSIPQDVGSFTHNITESENILEIQKKYKTSYFSPWNMEKPKESLDSISWPFLSFKVDNSYGINLQPVPEEFFIEMYNNYNFDDYLSVSKKAITLRYASMRALPTDKPIFRDPKKAGEGFPFDYLQNSSIAANKPIFVSHYSKDKKWVMVFSSFTYGWIKVSQMAFMGDNCTKKYQKSEQIFLLKDDIPLYSKKGDFLLHSRLGMMLELISEDKDTYTVLVVTADKNLSSKYLKSVISKEFASKDILHLNRENFESIISGLVGTSYDWGGRYGNRDCSSLLRDIFLPFGIWLPRNSSHQSKIGEIISFKGLSDKAKLALIKEKAIPFQTILFRKGHVLLYVGVHKGEVIVFHDIWGIRTKKNGVKGRIVVGKSVFSTLLIGQEHQDFDIYNSHLRNIRSMGIVTKEAR